MFHPQSAEETMHVGQQLAARMEPRLPVLLFGDLGSGKTHFVKGIAKGLGIQDTIKSPTFAYVNEYEIKSGQHIAAGRAKNKKKRITDPSSLTPFYHYDLYRLENQHSFHTIGLEDTLNDPQALNVIEWADRMGDRLPENYIRVECEAKVKHHAIRLIFKDSEILEKGKVKTYWDQWFTPLHVRQHCQKVAEVAVHIGKAFVAKNILVDLNLVYTAALLHDMARVCDFRELDRNKFQEEVTDEKWAAWVHQRKEFAGQHHADIAHQFLLAEGYQKTAELIRLHNPLKILEEPKAYRQCLEAALVYYADKRVKHDQVVSLAERFRDAQERNGGGHPEKEKLYEQAQEKKIELEQWIFEQVEMGAEEMG